MLITRWLHRLAALGFENDAKLDTRQFKMCNKETFKFYILFSHPSAPLSVYLSGKNVTFLQARYRVYLAVCTRYRGAKGHTT